jgi:hypothetical protein
VATSSTPPATPSTSLYTVGLILWALLATSEITGTPALTDRAFTLLIAGAITATIAGILTSIAAPLHAASAC